MIQTAQQRFDLRGLLGRVGWRHAPAPVFVDEQEAPPTAANSSGITTTGWDALGFDSLVGGAVSFAEQRRRLAEEVVVDLMIRGDLREAPEAIQRFLLRAWPQVIAHARLADATLSSDPGGYLAVVDDLLWSVRRESTLRSPARLFEMIPGLLARLRSGLALLGEERRETEAFFAELERLHRPVLRLCVARRQDGQPVVEATRRPGAETAAVMQALRRGVWVELYSGERWVRARLDWVEPQGRQFLFTSRHGHSHAMTRRILERLVCEQLLRLIERPGAKL